MGDLISRLQGDGATLWRPDVKEAALNKSTIRPKSQPRSMVETEALRLRAKCYNHGMQRLEIQGSIQLSWLRQDFGRFKS